MTTILFSLRNLISFSVALTNFTRFDFLISIKANIYFTYEMFCNQSCLKCFVINHHTYTRDIKILWKKYFIRNVCKYFDIYLSNQTFCVIICMNWKHFKVIDWTLCRLTISPLQNSMDHVTIGSWTNIKFINLVGRLKKLLVFWERFMEIISGQISNK